uniref:AcidPPc domain-containing protein n=1 Tax=Panagrellus redivivus TaxID=6233 RepID=A0A7E4WAY9_PANRE
MTSGGEVDTTEVKPLQLICQAALIFTFGASSYLTVVFGPRKRGFFCGDESIHYPFLYSTVPMAALHIGFYALLIPTIISVEYYCSRYIYPKFSSKLPKKYECNGYPIHAGLVRGVQFFLISQLGYMIDIFFLNITKYSVGRLRPHFLAVCRPSINVSTVEACGGATTYIEHYLCLGKDDGKMVDARLSFYSGHTSHSFYWAVFISLYLYARISRRHKGSVCFVLLSTLLVAIAALIGYSRVSDNKHHVSDVAVGAAAGTLIAALMFYIFRRLFFDVIFFEDNTYPEAFDIPLESVKTHQQESITTNVTPVTTAANSVCNQSAESCETASADEQEEPIQKPVTVAKKTSSTARSANSRNDIRQHRPQIVQPHRTNVPETISTVPSVVRASVHNPESHV